MKRKYTLYYLIATFFVTLAALFPQASFASLGVRPVTALAETPGMILFILLCGVALLLFGPIFLTVLERREHLQASSLSLKISVCGMAGVLLSALLWLLVLGGDIIFFRGVRWIGFDASIVILGIFFALFSCAICYYVITVSSTLLRTWRWFFCGINVIFITSFTVWLVRIYQRAREPRRVWVPGDSSYTNDLFFGGLSEGHYNEIYIPYVRDPYDSLFRIFLLIVVLIVVSSLMRFVFRRYVRSSGVTEKVI